MPDPIRCALIGIGARARKLYLPLAAAVAPWIRFGAVCSPNAESAAEAAERLGVPAFTSIGALLDAELVDAAIVLSPIESHHAISLTLSRRGIHHLVETTMASTVRQARDMAAVARENGVTLLVAENYFRFPFDRLARRVADSGAIGEVRRITCYHDQVGFHGHARWQKFFGSAPESVQSIQHTMPTARHFETARRVHESETFRACFLQFSGERMAIDMAGNTKGLIGRVSRPGLTEIDGSRGAILRLQRGEFDGTAEVRIASDAALERDGRADWVAPFSDRIQDGQWLDSSVQLPDGCAEWVNYFRPGRIAGERIREWDAGVVMEIMVQFAEQVLGAGTSEFTAEDAVTTTEIEIGCRESALRGGEAVSLPLDLVDCISEAAAARAVEAKFGVDIMDAQAVADLHFPPAA